MKRIYSLRNSIYFRRFFSDFQNDRALSKNYVCAKQNLEKHLWNKTRTVSTAYCEYRFMCFIQWLKITPALLGDLRFLWRNYYKTKWSTLVRGVNSGEWEIFVCFFYVTSLLNYLFCSINLNYLLNSICCLWHHPQVGNYFFNKMFLFLA